jgi:2-C-methyl-D-erythritol 2,4-cyclodiphosphate synthase
MSPRIGIGYDLHRLVPDRPLTLAGVQIPHDRGLLGHSDGDVVLHALCDALLGAVAQPDIGELFPDTDPAWKDADSRRFVREALARVRAAGYQIANVDLIIHAERPKLAPHKPQLRQALADLLALPPDRIGVKAKTNESLDAVGRGEALACWAAVLLEPALRNRDLRGAPFQAAGGSGRP